MFGLGKFTCAAVSQFFLRFRIRHTGRKPSTKSESLPFNAYHGWLLDATPHSALTAVTPLVTISRDAAAACRIGVGFQATLYWYISASKESLSSAESNIRLRPHFLTRWTSTAMAPGSGRVHDEQTMAASLQREMGVSVSRPGLPKARRW